MRHALFLGCRAPTEKREAKMKLSSLLVCKKPGETSLSLSLSLSLRHSSHPLSSPIAPAMSRFCTNRASSQFF